MSKLLLPLILFAAPVVHALPEFDTELVGNCRRAAELEISARNQSGCPGPAFVRKVTDIDDNRYTVEFVRPACRIEGEAELTFGLHEELNQDGHILVTRCQLRDVRISDDGL